MSSESRPERSFRVGSPLGFINARAMAPGRMTNTRGPELNAPHEGFHILRAECSLILLAWPGRNWRIAWHRKPRLLDRNSIFLLHRVVIANVSRERACGVQCWLMAVFGVSLSRGAGPDGFQGHSRGVDCVPDHAGMRRCLKLTQRPRNNAKDCNNKHQSAKLKPWATHGISLSPSCMLLRGAGLASWSGGGV